MTSISDPENITREADEASFETSDDNPTDPASVPNPDTPPSPRDYSGAVAFHLVNRLENLLEESKEVASVQPYDAPSPTQERPIAYVALSAASSTETIKEKWYQ